MSNSVRPNGRQPTRLPCPWDSPGKNTGVGCHFLLQCMKVKSESEVTQSCPTPWTAASQAPPSMEFSRQEYWSGVPLPISYIQMLLCQWGLMTVISYYCHQQHHQNQFLWALKRSKSLILKLSIVLSFCR